MEGKKIAIYVVLLAVVIGAVVLAVKRVASNPAPPSWVLAQQVQKIDCKTLELVSASLGDWNSKYAPQASDSKRWKNPKTGEYTMVDPIKCAACGQLIPGPDYSATLRHAAPTAPAAATSNGLPPPMPASDVDMTLFQKIQREYRCPKCGKIPFL